MRGRYIKFNLYSIPISYLMMSFKFIIAVEVHFKHHRRFNGKLSFCLLSKC